ncbi:prolyl 3-hydroxylase OGFOD1-like [Nilaparvata lugens]|uniref:prolyl 3-hydroxylase OGFOD1-like n=1 Tax=Nilaparvata lugens TaxID=108931 RepID=UPI00193CF0E1|nr:prolyl 3-hydroxylase OGFOD1-like [Nilaparvata lugens]
MDSSFNQEFEYLSTSFSNLLKENRVQRYDLLDSKQINNYGSLQVLTIDNLLEPFVISNLIAELKSFDYRLEITDLYSFRQSKDFRVVDGVVYPMCVKIHKIFESRIRQLVEVLFDMKLDGEVSMTASEYVHIDFLLTHDDREEDRGVAFILYLEDWSKRDGGTLDFRHHNEMGCAEDILFSILPAENRLTLFSVNELSHHQVAEVLAFDKPRIAISGWFHTGKPSNNRTTHPDRLPLSQNILINHPVSTLTFPTDYQYLQQDIHYYVQNSMYLHREIVNHRCVLLKPFLSNDCYEEVLTELQSDKIVWKTVGPASRRNYQTAQMMRRGIPNCPNTTRLLRNLQGTNFLKLLSVFVLGKLDNAIEEDIVVSADVIRIEGGDYILLTSDMIKMKSSIDLWIFLNVDHIDGSLVGVLGYSKQETHQKISYTITPKSNNAYIVARSSDMHPYMTYISKTINNRSHYAIKISFSVSFNTKELHQDLKKLPVICYESVGKMAAIDKINESIEIQFKTNSFSSMDIENADVMDESPKFSVPTPLRKKIRMRRQKKVLKNKVKKTKLIPITASNTSEKLRPLTKIELKQILKPYTIENKEVGRIRARRSRGNKRR